MQPIAQPKEQMCIFITASREIDDEEIIIDDFDENDRELYFDVSAYDVGIDEEMVYSIAATNYSNFLSYTVDEKTLNKISPESILAHSLYEITAYGFEDNI